MVKPPAPELFALLGDPVEGNPTQEVVEDAFRRAGLNWRYVSVNVADEDLPAAVAGLRAMRFRGVHITKPHKVAAVLLVDSLTPTAEAVDAVNCLYLEDGRFVGDNTDGAGFVAALRPVIDPHGLDVALFGAGGAARAIAVELAFAGVRSIDVYNRHAERRAHLAAVIRRLGVSSQGHDWPVSLTAPPGDIIVNATSIGMVGEEHVTIPVDWTGVDSRVVAADAVIDEHTPFLTAAINTGHRVVTGVEMLVEQAALSLDRWTGVSPDKAAIRQILVTELELKQA